MTTPMTVDCEYVREQLDAWAIGALDRADTVAVDRHLARCADCSPLAARARDAAAMLALSLPMTAASPSLRRRVLDAAGAPPQALRPRSDPGGATRRRNWWPVAAAAALTVALGGIAWAATLQSQLADVDDRNDQLAAVATQQAGRIAAMQDQVELVAERNAALEETNDALVEIMAQPDVAQAKMFGTWAAPGASGRYVWSRSSGVGVLVAEGLKPLPDDERYCLWLVYQDGWVLGGQFSVDEQGYGRVAVRDIDTSRARGAFGWFAVTVEPAAGAPEHRSAPVLLSE
jgi:anti-sigma-K factor RskA